MGIIFISLRKLIYNDNIFKTPYLDSCFETLEFECKVLYSPEEEFNVSKNNLLNRSNMTAKS